MYNWAGKFNLLLFVIFSFVTSLASAGEEFSIATESLSWEQYSKEVEKQQKNDYRNGLSYIISGSIAIVGGLVGSQITDDAFEKGIYTVFQTLGVASIGYGAFIWKIGGDERNVYRSLDNLKLTSSQKTQFLKNYYFQKHQSERKEKYIKAITHGLIAGVNFYNSSTQGQETIKNTLNFIGVVNLLACFSYTFEF